MLATPHLAVSARMRQGSQCARSLAPDVRPAARPPRGFRFPAGPGYSQLSPSCSGPCSTPEPYAHLDVGCKDTAHALLVRRDYDASPSRTKFACIARNCMNRICHCRTVCRITGAQLHSVTCLNQFTSLQELIESRCGKSSVTNISKYLVSGQQFRGPVHLPNRHAINASLSLVNATSFANISRAKITRACLSPPEISVRCSSDIGGRRTIA
jgi:hypothetical protein